MRRTCDICNGTFEAKRRDARYCGSTCRNNRARGVKPAAPRGEPGVISLVEATRQELTTAGKADTVLGQLALELAGRMRGTTTGLAALSKEFRAVKDAALGVQLSGTPGSGTADTVDELRARRNAKRAV